MTDTAMCPRCEKRPLRVTMPDGTELPGALSRSDNKTEVCSICGNDEAMVNFIEKRPAQPSSEWPVNTPYGDQIESGLQKGGL